MGYAKNKIRDSYAKKIVFRISYFVFFIIATAMMTTSCETDKGPAAFGISETEIFAGADGVSAKIRVSADDYWRATWEDDTPDNAAEWIMISPANGRASTEVTIQVDTTTVSGGSGRRADVVFVSAKNPNDRCTLRVEQYPYKNFIVVSTVDKPLNGENVNTGVEYSVPEYADTEKRYLDVQVVSNVNFTIAKGGQGGGNWVSNDEYKFELDRGARPRKTRIRFRYQNNTLPSVRTATVTFNSESGSLDAGSTKNQLTIVQKEAPKLDGISRRSDSLAVVAIARAIGFDMSADEGESMDRWDFVRLWRVGDKGYTADKAGRLRSVTFSSFRTWLNIKDFSQSDQLPYELGYLTSVEELILYANSSRLLVSLNSGRLGELVNLKRLVLYAVGIDELLPDFANLENLEYLDLSGNNFNEVPALLTSENFPKLRHLDLGNNVRYTIVDFTETGYREDQWGGLYDGGAFPTQLLGWDALTYLSLGNNYIHGELPDVGATDFPTAVYNASNGGSAGRQDTIAYAITNSLPYVWPNLKTLRINLNYLKGDLPDWLLYHPNLDEWDPSSLVFNQASSYLIGADGQPSTGFDNVPVNDDYYYTAYPKKKPTN